MLGRFLHGRVKARPSGRNAPITMKQGIDVKSFREQLLSSLPPGYDNLIEILNEQEDSLSVEDVIRKFQESEMARVKRGSVLSSNTASVSGEALMAGSGRGVLGYRGGGLGRGGYRSAPYRFRGKCHRCGEIGHRASQCGKGLSGGSGQTSSLGQSSAMSCFGCGEQGHRKKTCPNPTLTQAQAARGWESFLKWKAACPGISRSALIASADGEIMGGCEPGGGSEEPTPF